MATRPTKKQQQMLSFIENFVAANGYGPSYREIMRGLDYKSVSTVAIHVDNLISRGHLVKRDNSARSLEVVKGEGVAAETKDVNTHQKWLISQVETKFSALNRAEEPAKVRSELNTLLEAMKILGMRQQAEEFTKRLDSTNS